MKQVVFFLTIVGLSFLLPFYLFAYTASSTQYGLETDSVNSGGTSYSTSTTYKGADTIGDIGTGISTSTTYSLSAGYWASSAVWISMQASSSVAIGTINGITGGTVTGSGAYIVTTNSLSGYQLIVQASTSPAMTSASSSIPNYVTQSSDPDFSFTIASSSDARFGFSPEGTDILARFKDNGSTCNAGALDTVNACWDGFATTSQKVVAQGSGANNPNGATTTIKYRVQIGSSKVQPASNPSSVYSANITVTAVTL